jgi:hypothetical protein
VLNGPVYSNLTVLSATGPEVVIVSPDLQGECRSPVSIVARFTPLSGHEVDLSTLKVEWLKFITFDLTSKVRPFATQEGIMAEEVSLPRGRHKLRISLGDTGGGLTQLLFEVKIA